MRRHVEKVLAVSVSALLVFSIFLAGCGPIESNGGSTRSSYTDESAGPMNCVIIYSNHANSSASTDGLEKYVRGVKESNGYLNFVCLDGKPTKVFKSEDAQTSTKNNNEARIKNENKKFVSDRMEALESISASTAEVDVFGAIEVANRCLGQANDESLENVVVFVGTGLPTKGKIDFTKEPVTSSFLKDYQTWIVENGILPQLENIDKIVWYGFDQVAEPQQKPSERTKNELQEFYQSLFTSVGVRAIDFEESGDEEEPDNDYYVTPVQLPPEPKFRSGQRVDIPDNVLFEAGLAVFRGDADPSTNEDIINAANNIKNYNDKVKVIGYIAHYGDPNDKTLCLQRAEAVKSLLIERFGCPPGNITTEGGGFGPYGDDDEKNRCVQIVFE